MFRVCILVLAVCALDVVNDWVEANTEMPPFFTVFPPLLRGVLLTAAQWPLAWLLSAVLAFGRHAFSFLCCCCGCGCPEDCAASAEAPTQPLLCAAYVQYVVPSALAAADGYLPGAGGDPVAARHTAQCPRAQQLMCADDKRRATPVQPTPCDKCVRPTVAAASMRSTLWARHAFTHIGVPGRHRMAALRWRTSPRTPRLHHAASTAVCAHQHGPDP